MSALTDLKYSFYTWDNASLACARALVLCGPNPDSVCVSLSAVGGKCPASGKSGF